MGRVLVRTAAAGAAAICLGLSFGGAASAQTTDEHFGVQGVQGTQDVAAVPAAAAPAPAPAPVEQSGGALPVTGSDVATTAVIGIALVAGGTVLVRRRATADD